MPIIPHRGQHRQLQHKPFPATTELPGPCGTARAWPPLLRSGGAQFLPQEPPTHQEPRHTLEEHGLCNICSVKSDASAKSYFTSFKGGCSIFLTPPRRWRSFCSRSFQIKERHQRTEHIKSSTEASPYIVLDASALQLLDFCHQSLKLLASLSVEFVVFDRVPEIHLALLTVVPNILQRQKAPSAAHSFHLPWKGH